MSALLGFDAGQAAHAGRQEWLVQARGRLEAQLEELEIFEDPVSNADDFRATYESVHRFQRLKRLVVPLWRIVHKVLIKGTAGTNLLNLDGMGTIARPSAFLPKSLENLCEYTGTAIRWLPYAVWVEEVLASAEQMPNLRIIDLWAGNSAEFNAFEMISRSRRLEHIDGSISTGAYRREHIDGSISTGDIDGSIPTVTDLLRVFQSWEQHPRIRTSTAITNKWDKKEGSPTCYSKSSMVEAIENERDSKSDLLKKL
jgi:hypothetical protein